MGQKVNPHGMRVGVIKDWDSRWYAEADFADNLIEDHKIRTYLKKRLYSAGVSKIEIERASDRVKIIVFTAKPGVVIGKGGSEIEKVKAEVQKMTAKKVFVDIKEVKRPDREAQLVAESIAQQLENRVSFRRAMKSTMSRSMKAGVSKIEIERASDRVKIIVFTAKPGVVIGKGGSEIEKVKAEVQKMTAKKVFVDIKEVKRPDREAQLVAESIAQQLENRVSFRRAMKSTMSRSMKAGVLGIKTAVGGRLGGADIARTEFYSEGTIPLQTLRADIDYGFAEADTTYGKLGVKVWIYKGEVLPTKGNKEGSDK